MPASNMRLTADKGVGGAARLCLVRVNAAINWFSGNDQWRVSLYGKNLTDEVNWGNLTSIAGLFTAGPMQRGRIVGVEVNWQNR